MRNTPSRRRLTTDAMLVLGWILVATRAHSLEVHFESDRPGHLFTDSEPVDVRVRVAGAAAAATIDYRVSESAGDWTTSGRMALRPGANGSATKRLPLGLPGRGLYRVDLSATAGAATAKAHTWVAVVFTPAPPDEKSPWGIFYTPHIWFDRDNANGPRDAAVGHRLLGASWSRLNFWAHSFGTVTLSPGEDPPIEADWSLWKEYARELRREGIFIFGEIAQCPRALSSRPDETSTTADAGPVYNRVKPRDYALWDRLMEDLARDFREEIGIWEIWNEANYAGRYWLGTHEEFIELVRHTSAAFKRGNPDARVAAAGFVHGYDYADKLLQLGMGKYIDIFSVHYTDERTDELDGYKRLLVKHGLTMPIWNSEEKSEIPVRNIAGGIERSFKFIHVSIGYPDFRPLVRKDMTVLPSGIHFSVGAHCIGTAEFVVKRTTAPGCEVFLFRRGREVIATIDAGQGKGEAGHQPRLFAGPGGSVTLAVEPLGRTSETRPRVTDVWGRTRWLVLRRGKAHVPTGGGMVIVNGCRSIDVTAAGDSQQTARSFEAESGRFSPGWVVSAKPGFSGGRVVEIWKSAEPGPEGYWVEVTMDVPRAGRYELFFSGNSLSRLAPPQSISPFAWSIDGAQARRTSAPVPETKNVPGAPEGLGKLGEVTLSAGRHVFRLTLTGRRTAHDSNYALWFDAIGIRRK